MQRSWVWEPVNFAGVPRAPVSEKGSSRPVASPSPFGTHSGSGVRRLAAGTERRLSEAHASTLRRSPQDRKPKRGTHTI